MDFNVYIFSAHACITLTSILIFGGKKMQSSRQESCLSTKFFKWNINEM